MPTFVSMLNWSGDPQPEPGDVRDAINSRATGLRACGLHSLVLLPDKGVCAAIMISHGDTSEDVTALAAAILPRARVRVESILFDDEPAGLWLLPDVSLADDELTALYEAMAA
ncbi:MAG: hypothetical protein M3P30_07920 [Chloroflexota bacterium]|nr:hypothetical protein [Chloroflexota bacterium]